MIYGKAYLKDFLDKREGLEELIENIRKTLKKNKKYLGRGLVGEHFRFIYDELFPNKDKEYQYNLVKQFVIYGIFVELETDIEKTTRELFEVEFLKLYERAS